MSRSSPTGVSENRVAQLERRVAELRATRLLVGGLAHDFNNLLTAIQGHAAMITSETDPGSEAQESAEAIMQATDHAAAIAKRLQSLVQGAPAKREPVDIHQTIAEVVALLKPATNGRIQIVEKLQSGSSLALADPDQMHQMMLNLALNARDSMSDGGVLTFETAEEPGGVSGHLVITVRDTGSGIPKADRERIFEPFFTTRKTGTGLGLAVVAGIVQKHQGSIWLENCDGPGCEFKVRLPLAAKPRRVASSGRR